MHFTICEMGGKWRQGPIFGFSADLVNLGVMLRSGYEKPLTTTTTGKT
jgi:hypothetical protein